MGVHCTILSTFLYVWTFSLKILGGEEKCVYKGTWHHGKNMSFRVTEIWMRVLTLLSLGRPNILPELCSSEPVTGRNPQTLVPSFLASRHQAFSLPFFMKLECGPTYSWATRRQHQHCLPDKGHHPSPFSSRIVSNAPCLFSSITLFSYWSHMGQLGRLERRQ